MKKHTAKIVTLLLTIVFAVCLAMGLAGCNSCSSDNGNYATETKYDAIYDAYAEVVGNDALSHDEWYGAYMDSIDEVELGEFQIESATLVTDNGKNYVEFVIDGKIYLLDLDGNDFTQSVVFVLTVTKKNGDAVGDVNLDIYNVSTGKTWRTDKTASDGTVKLYVPAADSNTYGVKVSATGNSNLSYSIPEGEEPTFSISSENTEVSVVLEELVTYVIQVRDAVNGPIQGAALGVYKIDGESSVEIAFGVSGVSGNITFFLTLEEGAIYAIRFRDIEDAIPEGFHSEQDEFELNLTTKVTRIVLLKDKKTYDSKISAQNTIIDQEDADPKYQPAPIEVNPDLETYMRKDENGYYVLDSLGTYSTLYVALDYPLAQVMGKKVSIYDLLKDSENEYLFVKEVPYTEGGITEEEAILANTWTRYIYTDMLIEYCEKLNSDGVYPLNDDLLGFLKACSYLFNGYTGADTDWQLAVVYYDGPKLGVGEGAVSSTVRLNGDTIINVAIRNDIPAGLYNIKFVTSNSVMNGSPICYIIDGYRYDFATTKTSGAYAGKTPIYLHPGIDTIGLYYTYFYGTMPSGYIQIDPYNDTVFPIEIPEEGITEAGEYEVPLVPTAVKNSGLAVRLPNRLGYKYTVELLELPEGVTSVTLNVPYSTGQYTKDNWPSSDTVATATMNKVGATKTYTVVDSVTTAKPWANPGIYFTYSGSEITTIKVKITIELTQIDITYSAGEGVGVVAGATGQKAGALYALASAEEMTKPGYIFAGWKDEVSGNVYYAGEVITLPGYNLNLVAQWRKEAPYVAEGTLDTTNSVTAVHNSSLYSLTQINLSQLDGGYLLIVDFGANNPGDYVRVYVGDTLVRLVRDAVRSGEDGNVYIGYIELGSSVKSIIFPTEVVTEFSATITVSLTKSDAVLQLDEEVLVPFGSYGITEEDAWKITLGNTVLPNQQYTLTYIPYDAAHTFTATFSGITNANKSFGNSTSTSNTYRVAQITVGDDVAMAYIYLASKTASDTYYSIAYLKLEIVYSVTYVLGEGATGGPSALNYQADGTEVTIGTATPTRLDYTFEGWSLDGESVYDESHAESYLHGGDKVTIKGANIVLTAVWKAKTINTVALGVGDANKAENVKFNLTTYNGGTRLTLATVPAGKYIITAEFDTDLNKVIAYSLSRNKDLQFVQIDELNSESKYVYYTYIYLAEAGTNDYLHFELSTASNATFTLKAYNETLTIGNNYNIIPFNRYGTADGAMFRMKIASGMDGATYKIEGKNYTALSNPSSVKISFTNDTGETLGTENLSLFSSGSLNTVTIPQGATYGTITAYSNSTSYDKEYTCLGVKLTRLYSVTYVGGESAVGTAPASHTKLSPNTTIGLKPNTFAKPGYDFAGWKTEGSETLYKPGDFYTVEDKDVVFTAQWTESVEITGSLGVGSNVTGTLKKSGIHAVSLANNISAGLYTLKLESANDFGFDITITVDGVQNSLIKSGESSGKYEYISYIYITATTKEFLFNVTVAEDTNVTFSLSAYTQVVVLVDGNTYIVPVNAYGTLAADAVSFIIKTRDGETFNGGNISYIIRKYVSSTAILVSYDPNESAGFTITVPDASTDATTVAQFKDLQPSETVTAVNIWHLTGNLSSYKYGFTVAITISPCFNVSYEGGEGAEGSVTSHTNQLAGAIITLNNNKFTLEGKTFVGWTCDGGDTIYKEGDKFEVPYKNVVFTAVWRDGGDKKVDGTLNLGSNIDINLDYLSSDTTTVLLGEDVTAGTYTLKVSLDSDYGNFIEASYGEITIRIVRSVALSVGGKYVYIGYIYVPVKEEESTVDYSSIIFKNAVTGVDPHATINLSLESYVAPTLKGDGSIIEVPVNPYAISSTISTTNNHFRFNLDASLCGKNIQIVINDYSDNLYSNRRSIFFFQFSSDGHIENNGVSGDIKATSFSGWNTPIYNNTIEICLNFGTSTASLQQYIMVGISAKPAYQITYEANGGTGTTSASALTPLGASVKLASNNFTAPTGTAGVTYLFAGWKLKGDESDTIYQPQDIVTMPEGGAVYVAQWKEMRAYAHSTGALSLTAPLSNVMFGSTYSATTLKLSAGIAANTSYTLRIIFPASSCPTSSAILVTFNDYKTNPVYLTRSESSTASQIIYTGGIRLSAASKATDLLYVHTDETFGSQVRATQISLSAFSTPTLRADGKAVDAVMQNASYSYSYFSINLDSTFNVGEKYEFTVTFPEGVTIPPSAGLYYNTYYNFSNANCTIEGNTVKLTITMSTTTSVVVYAGTSSPTCHSAVKVSAKLAS